MCCGMAICESIVEIGFIFVYQKTCNLNVIEKKLSATKTKITTTKKKTAAAAIEIKHWKKAEYIWWSI